MPQNINLEEIRIVNRLFAKEIERMVIQSERERRHWKTYSRPHRKIHFTKHINRIVFLTWMGITRPEWYFDDKKTAA